MAHDIENRGGELKLSAVAEHVNRLPDGLLVTLMLVMSGLIVISPIFDYDLYWHLAFGREMWATGEIIQQEPFSYTAEGIPFHNRAWLAQWIFFALQSLLGWHALLGLKLLITACVALLMYGTARFFDAGRGIAALTVSLGILAGHYRYTERPEIFSLLLIALLAYVLAGWRTARLREGVLLAVPPIMLVWDWLHGGIFGLVFLCTFVGIENLFWHFAPGLKAACAPRRLNWVFGLTLLVMLANPLGLTTYAEFLGHLGGISASQPVNNVEYEPLNWREFKSFWVVTVAFSIFAIMQWKRMPLAHALAAIAFLLLAMQVRRMVGVAMILAVPLLAVALTQIANQIDWRRIAGQIALGFLAFVLIADGISHKFLHRESTRKFGWHLDEQFFPVGGVRFVKENSIGGKLFNTGHLGGYLAWELYPYARVFHYNNGATFGDPYRFWGRPDLLKQYDINYAFIALGEEFKLFPAHAWARIYRDSAATLVLKRTPENAELISRFEWHQFHPMMNSHQLDVVALHPAKATRLFEEMVIYLAYREDMAIAAQLVRLANRNPEAALGMRMPDQLEKAIRRNPSIALAFQR